MLTHITNPPVLAYPDYSSPFVLHTDASEVGLGAILYQRQNGKMRVVGYGSRSLTPAEKRYQLHSSKLEFLALKWAVCDHFRDHLYHAPHFTAYTDNNPLKYILSTAGLNATGHRWVAELADFNFDIKYRPGKVDVDADVLSCLPLDIEKYISLCTCNASESTINAAVNNVKAQVQFNIPWISAVTAHSLKVQPDEEFLHQKPKEPLNMKSLLIAQERDLAISTVVQYKLSGHKPSYHQRHQNKETPATRALMREWNKLFIGKDRLLRLKSREFTQLILPRSFQKFIFQELHQDMGHLDPERVYHMARERFFWPNMYQDIEHFVTKVCPCLKQRRPSFIAREPLQSLTSSSPFDLVSIDFLHLEQSSGGYEYVLVIMDHFTCFAQTYAAKNKSAHTADSKLFNEFIPRFGFPARLHHDQGKEFENSLFRSLEQFCGIIHSRTSPYYLEGNGQVERFNCTLLAMLRTLLEEKKSKWKEHLNKVMHAYNCTRHNSTGFSPFYLHFGRSPRHPIDILFADTNPAPVWKYSEYAMQWQNAMESAYKIASDNATLRYEQNKAAREPKVNSTVLLPGDHVLVRNLSKRGGPGKLRPHWEETIRVVVRRLTDESLVYQVRPVTSKGKVRNLHQNLLLPCDYLLLETTQQSPEVSAHSKKLSLRTSPELTQEVASKPIQEQQTHQPVRPKRQHKIPKCFTYDTIGSLSFRPVVNTVHTALYPNFMPMLLPAPPAYFAHTYWPPPYGLQPPLWKP